MVEVVVVLKTVEKGGPAFWFWLAGVVPAALLLAGVGPIAGLDPFFWVVTFLQCLAFSVRFSSFPS